MIVVVSLNSAWDVIVQAPSWAPGIVERAERQEIVPGGKAINVARTCGRMGTPVRLVALADAHLADRLEETLPARVERHLVVTRTRSRTDVCLTTGQGATTVVNGAVPEPAHVDLVEAIDMTGKSIAPGDVLVLAGRQPPGTMVGLLALAAERTARLVVDTSGPDLAASLDVAPTVAKVNSAELAAISRSRDEEGVWDDARSLAPQPRELVITRGATGLRAWLAGGSVVQVTPPTVRPVNDFGAGDALTAGIVTAISQGRPLVDGLVMGSAWAAATVQTLGLDFDADGARKLEKQVVVKAVGDGSMAGGQVVASGLD